MLDIIENGQYPQKRAFKHQEDILLDNMVGKSFWCIRSQETKVGPKIPYQGKLIKGINSWNLEDWFGCSIVITNIDDLFLDQESATIAYINAQTVYIEELENELKKEKEILLEVN